MLKYIKVNNWFQDFVSNEEELKTTLEKVKYHFKGAEDIQNCIESFKIFFDEDPAFKIEEMVYTTKEDNARISIINRGKLEGYNSNLSIGTIEDIFPDDSKELTLKVNEFIETLKDELENHGEYLNDYGVSIKGNENSLSDSLLISEGSGNDTEEIEVNGTKYIISYSFDN